MGFRRDVFVEIRFVRLQVHAAVDAAPDGVLCGDEVDSLHPRPHPFSPVGVALASREPGNAR